MAPPDQLEQRADDVADAEDAEEPWTYLAQSMVGFATRDNALSMSATKRAIQISPSFAQAHGLLGVSHAYGGRYAEALAAIDHAVRLSPREVFHGDIGQYSRMMAFVGAGSVTGALIVAWLGRFKHMGLTLLVIEVLYGMLIVAFSLSRTLWLSDRNATLNTRDATRTRFVSAAAAVRVATDS